MTDKKDDWNFKVSAVDLAGDSEKAKVVDKEKLLKKRAAPSAEKKMTLDDTTGVPKKSRRVQAIESEQALRQERFLPASFLPKRAIAGAIEMGIVIASWFVVQMFLPEINARYLAFLVEQQMNQPLDPDVLDFYLHIASTSLVLLVLLVLPVFLLGRGIGSIAMGLRIGGKHPDDIVSRSSLLLREFVFRPLSLVTVVGILMALGKSRRGLHDILAGTSVYPMGHDQD